MSDRYLDKYQIAALIGAAPRKAALFLQKRGLRPVDLGGVRGKGLRWLESEVLRTMRQAFEEAQPKPKKPRRTNIPGLSKPLIEHSASELYEILKTEASPQNLDSDKALTDCRIVQ